MAKKINCYYTLKTDIPLAWYNSHIYKLGTSVFVTKSNRKGYDYQIYISKLAAEFNNARTQYFDAQVTSHGQDCYINDYLDLECE